GPANGLENVRTDRAIAAKADDVARLGDASDRLALGEGANSIRIPRSSSVSGEVAVCPDICRGKQRVPVGIESKEVAVELARPKPARRQVDTLVALRGSVLSCRGNAGADVVNTATIATGTIYELREKNEIGVEWLSIARVSLLVQTPRGIEACGEVSTGVRLSDILPVEVNFATGCATASRRIDGCPVKDTGDLRAAGSSAGEYASSATLNIAAWRVLGRAFHDARDLENAPVALTRDGSCCGVGAVDGVGDTELFIVGVLDEQWAHRQRDRSRHRGGAGEHGDGEHGQKGRGASRRAHFYPPYLFARRGTKTTPFQDTIHGQRTRRASYPNKRFTDMQAMRVPHTSVSLYLDIRQLFITS